MYLKAYPMVSMHPSNEKVDRPTSVEHVTPEENLLASVQTNVQCQMKGCNKNFKSLSVLKFHHSQAHEHQKMKKVIKADCHIEKRFHCPVKDCIYYYTARALSRYFAKLQYLKQHYLKVHSTPSYPCTGCNKSFNTKSYLRAHQQYCDLNLVCSCGQKFSAITGLQTHVKRKGHDAEVLSVYALRVNQKKSKKFERPLKTSPNSSGGRYRPIQCKETPATRNPIFPKQQPPHLVAAIALSELAAAGLKRVSTVEIGVQTDPSTSRRLPRKSSSPIRSREPHVHKRKQTIEMETQTRLTNSKSKIRKKSTAKRVSKCSIATDTSLANADVPNSDFILKENANVGNPCPREPVVAFLVQPTPISLPSGLNETFSTHSEEIKNILSRDFENNANSSGTQTSSSFELNHYHIFKEVQRESPDNTIESRTIGNLDRKEISIQADLSLDKDLDLSVSNEEVLSTGIKSTEIVSTGIESANINASQILLDDDDNLMSMSPSGRLSPILPRRAPNLSQMRSSSIETQTDNDLSDHDVFISAHVLGEAADDVILTSTETQTELERARVGSPSLWCTSETQTCESFSDIEPFLCSDIHTQTGRELYPSSELFPELNNFTVDMHTQTRVDDSPVLVTTHTQTSIWGLAVPDD